MAKLKPCPFCGGTAKSIKHTFIDDEGLEDILGWTVECMTCHADTRGRVAEGEAIEDWNRRESGAMEWISTKDRLPEPGTEVLTYAKMTDVSYEGYSVALYNPEMYQPGWAYVTHWMPLPEPPEEVTP